MNSFKFSILSIFLVFSVTNAIGQTNQSLRINIFGGYGFGTSTKISNYSDATLQPYNLGFGIGVQYIFKSNLSLGIVFVTHKGESVTITPSESSSSIDIKARIQYTGVELGYWIRFNDTFSFYPHLGLGVGERKGNFFPESESDVIHTADEVTVISVEGLRPYISPEVSIIADITNFTFVGVKINYLVLTDYKKANSLGASLIAGINIKGIF